MNSKIFRASILSIVVTLGLSACGGGGSSSSVPASDVGKLVQVSVPSVALGTSRRVNIYTPYGYDTRTKYPVLYMYHGSGGDQDTWMGTGIDARANELIRDKKIKPLIIVAPEMDNSYGAGGNESFVYQELVQYIDTHYSTNPDRESRFIGGLSMGGFIALHNAFVHTEVFSKVGGHMPYLYTVAGLNDTIENPIVTAGYKDLRTLKVYLDTGEGDRMNLAPTNKVLFDILQAKGVPSENHLGPGGHDMAYLTRNIDNYLKFYAGI